MIVSLLMGLILTFLSSKYILIRQTFFDILCLNKSYNNNLSDHIVNIFYFIL